MKMINIQYSAKLYAKFDLKAYFLNHASLHRAIKYAMQNLNINPASSNHKPKIPPNIVPFFLQRKESNVCKEQLSYSVRAK